VYNEPYAYSRFTLCDSAGKDAADVHFLFGGEIGDCYATEELEWRTKEEAGIEAEDGVECRDNDKPYY